MTTTSVISKIDAVHARLERARAIVDAGLVEDLGNGVFIVSSQRGREHYTIDEHGCNCPDVQNRYELTNGWCKHRLAVAIVKEQQAE
jgi:hypothetical protein